MTYKFFIVFKMEDDKINNKATVNYSYESFKLLTEKDFIIGDKPETITTKNENKLFYYNILSICNKDLPPQNFTISLENINFTYDHNKKAFTLIIDNEKHNELFRLLKIFTSLFNDYFTNKDHFIFGNFYDREKNNKYVLNARNLNTKTTTINGSTFTDKDYIEIKNKSILAINLTLRFFVFDNSNKLFYNIRAVTVDTEYIPENVNLNISNIDYNTFKKLPTNERIRYYSSHISNYNDNENNEIYNWIGIYDKTKQDIYACDINEITQMIGKKEDFSVNTYLVKGKKELVKICNVYKDKNNFYHYLLTFLFNKHDTTPNELNKNKLFTITKKYLENRLIESLGIWYDQAQPPTNHIHFNVHTRSILPIHYFKLLFDEWYKYHGNVLIMYSYDPLMLRLYLARNHDMFIDEKVKYQTDKEIFSKARKEFKPYCEKYNPNELIKFLNNKFSTINIYNINVNDSANTTIKINNLEKVEVNKKEVNKQVENKKEETTDEQEQEYFTKILSILPKLSNIEKVMLITNMINDIDKDSLKSLQILINMQIKK
jgi:hypothetical protein